MTLIRSQRTRSIIIGILWLAVGIGLITWTIYDYYKAQTFALMAQTVKGTVIDFELVGGDPASYSPIVKFMTQTGETLQFSSKFAQSPPAYQIGNLVDVVYDPQKPNDAEIVGAGNLSSLIWIGFGLFFAVGGGAILVGEIRK